MSGPAVPKSLAITDEATNSGLRLAENQKASANSVRQRKSQEKPAPSMSWRDRSQPRNESAAFTHTAWRGGARGEDSGVFARKTSETGRDGKNPFGERRSKDRDYFRPESKGSASSSFTGTARRAFADTRNKFGSNSSIASNCSTSSAAPGENRKPFGDSRRFADSRNKFGSNSSIASNCSVSSAAPRENRKSFGDSRKKFDSNRSVASESSAANSGRGFGRGAPFTRAFHKSKATDERTKRTFQGAAGSSELSLEYLYILSQKEIHEIVLEVTIDRSPFEKYLQKFPLEVDWLIRIMNIVAKICVSEFVGNRSELLYKLCKSPFFENLSSYLRQMTVETDPEFLETLPAHDLYQFFSALLDAWPMLAVEKNLKNLIGKLKIAVNKIPLVLGGPDDDILSKLETLVDTYEERQLAKKQTRLKAKEAALHIPPDDFRLLSLHPTAEDLFTTGRGFLRPNKIKGAYDNVEHYLDVQFRLLREDFIDSVRSGIMNYLNSKSEGQKKFKFDSVRIYPDTCLESWERRSSSSQEVGIQLNFDPNKKFAGNWDWHQNKRFMHGSLLLLTADDFNSWTCATVLERDVASLKSGRVLVALVDETADFHKTFAKPFTMAESEVFFEPYFLVLQALKKLDDESFPLTEYIVEGQSATKSPVYPDEDIVRGLYLNSFLCISYRNRNYRLVGYDDALWKSTLDENGRLVPSGYEPKANIPYELDEYQTEAFEAGMERDFCVIQGPPGTGKTYVGQKLVKSILNECHLNKKRLPILVVCLSNHALDQFLERILAFTNKIVRVGGQSRNENLNNQNLRMLRSVLFHVLRGRDRDFESMTSKIKKEIDSLSQSIENMQKMKKYIETPVGILSTILLKLVVEPTFLPVVKNDETLLRWLLEDNECEAPLDDIVNFHHLYEDSTADQADFEPATAKKCQKNTYFNLKSICDVNCLKSYSITLDGVEGKLRITNEEFSALIENEGSPLEQDYNSSLIYLEKTYLKNQIKHLTRQYHKLKANLETFVETPEAKVLTALHQNPTELPSKSRWLIYWSWLEGIKKKLLLEISELETRHRAKIIQLDEYKMFEDLHIMKQADVVGMTTTGAARGNKLLALLKPAVVIIEEAAQVLEAHIVASLTKSCQHLILIGDHKQLRPSAAVYELSKHYNIDISLFERMINNGMHCPMLKVQHRMRPEISDLITPSIYPDLKDHESVLYLEPVEGVKKNLFFLEHNMPETVAFDDTSKENAHEAKFVVKLAKYFVQQGYSPENITLLTVYAGQMLRIRNLMRGDDDLKDVKCVVTDKYQGEENYIIILSLVRSNEDGIIGFLSTENRVCVALSRAKNGFFMIGNMDCLAHTKLWQKLRNTLEEKDAIGKELPLYCDRHDKITLVSKAEDFRLVSNGGCGAVCNLMMTCGHDCKKPCHPLLGEHKSDDCEEPCKRRCNRKHACKKLCKEDCGKCITLVEKILPCEHVACIRCHVADQDYLCTELVEDVLLSCDHIIKRKCHQRVEDVKCTKPCRKILSCGHTCTRLCHEEDDPDHLECKRECDKYYEDCKKSHLCKKRCYEECGRCPSKEIVNLSCGHTLTLPCSTDLSSVRCEKSCPKIIPTCGHEIDVKCSDEPNQKLCQQNCKLMAPCGHKCQLKCGEICSSKGCKEWVTSSAMDPLCGHQNVYVFCGEKDEVLKTKPESFLPNCREPCNTILHCGDVCAGTCGQCLQGRLHQACPEMCKRTFICGHRCKSTCRTICPPCNEDCSYSCPHSKCTEKCGIPCSTCKEPCQWKCRHSKCTRKCGDFCNRQPCNKPCELKLSCGHDCIGFCGEPCPPKCRSCNPEFGFENAPNARFVLMVDCNHIIESGALDRHFSPTLNNGEIVLRGCPQCGTPITKTLRCMNFVKRTYQQIAEVKSKNFKELRSFDLKKMFLDWRMLPSKCTTIPLFLNFAHFCIEKIPEQAKKHTIFSSEKASNLIYLFQACQALISPAREFGKEPMQNEFFSNDVSPYLDQLIRRLEISFPVNRQVMMDLNSEIRRYHLMVDYQCIYANSVTRFVRKDVEIPKICAEITEILFGFAKFTKDDEKKIRSLFEKLRARPAISSASSWPKEKLAVKKEVPRIFDDLDGRWFQCLDGHYYRIEQKETTTDCPECVKGTSATNKSGRRRRRGRR